MNPAEIESALKGMVVLVDTREQNTPALRARLKLFGKYERQKLEAGDYSAKVPLPDGGWLLIPVSVERKMDLDELANCYCKDRARFKREFDRAEAARIKMYLLIENDNLDKAIAGTYHSHMNERAMTASIFAWLARYNCQILFCDRKNSGIVIREILYRECKEALTRLVGDDSG